MDISTPATTINIRTATPSVSVSSAVMGAAVAATLTFVLVEAVAGWLAHSLALLSDAGHNLADAAALGFSWYALWIAGKPSHQGMTFGYHRVGVFAALANAALARGDRRCSSAGKRSSGSVSRSSPTARLMIGVAAAAIVVNLAIGLWLHSGAKDDLNIRSAYLHMIGDAVSALRRRDRRRAGRDDAARRWRIRSCRC